MTKQQIMKAQEKANVKFEVALKIREILDAARKEVGPSEWDANDMEAEILELVGVDE